MWPKHDDTPSLTPEQAERQISLLTDLIGLAEGWTPQDLHPEMSTSELVEHMYELLIFQSTVE